MTKLIKTLLVATAVLMLGGIFYIALHAQNRKQTDARLSESDARRAIASIAGARLNRDQVVIKNIQTFGSTASVTASVETAFRLEQGDDKRWTVAEVSTGEGKWESVELLRRALETEKRARAGAELETLSNALAAYRRERGAYVVSDNQSVLIDHLSPRYVTQIIRRDPWSNFYLYTGTPDRFELRSTGADGKANTPDDVVVSKSAT